VVGIGSGGGDASFTREGSGGRRAIRDARWINACVGSLRERTPGSLQINLASAHAPRNSIELPHRRGATEELARRSRVPCVSAPQAGGGQNRVSLYQPFRCPIKCLKLLCAAAKNRSPKGLIKAHAKKREGVGLEGSTQQHLVAWTGSTFLVETRVKTDSATDIPLL
jgi:hypothetical protein